MLNLPANSSGVALDLEKKAELYSIVIPCYCSGEWLDELVSRIKTSIYDLDMEFEIILVNDASPDEITWPKIQELSESNTEVRGLNLMSNVGQYRATLAGFSKSKGSYIITLDDDLQHYPEDIPILIEKMLSNPDVDCVMGSYKVKMHSLFSNFGSSLVHMILSRFYDKPKGLKSTAFRILRSDLAQATLANRSNKPNLMAVLSQSSKRAINVEVRHDERPYGRSGYGFSDLVRFTLDNIFAVTNAPLRYVSVAGIMAAFASLLLIGYYLTMWYLNEISVPGFTTQVLLISFFGGMTLFSVGLLGEYVTRISVEVSGPPLFFIRDDTEMNE